MKTSFNNSLSKWEATVLMNMHISDFREKPVCYIISICIGKKREYICSKVLIFNHHTSMSTHKPGVTPGPVTLSTQEPGAGKLQAPGQPGLQSENLSQTEFSGA